MAERDLQTALRFVPDDGLFRPRESFFLVDEQLNALLNAGLVEQRDVGDRPHYRRVRTRETT